MAGGVSKLMHQINFFCLYNQREKLDSLLFFHLFSFSFSFWLDLDWGECGLVLGLVWFLGSTVVHRETPFFFSSSRGEAPFSEQSRGRMSGEETKGDIRSCGFVRCVRMEGG